MLSCTAWQQIPWEARGPRRAGEPHTEPPQGQAELSPVTSSPNTTLWLSHALFALVPSPSHLPGRLCNAGQKNLTWDCCISSAFLAEEEHLHCFCLLDQPAFCCRQPCLHVAACDHTISAISADFSLHFNFSFEGRFSSVQLLGVLLHCSAAMQCQGIGSCALCVPMLSVHVCTCTGTPHRISRQYASCPFPLC